MLRQGGVDKLSDGLLNDKGFRHQPEAFAAS